MPMDVIVLQRKLSSVCNQDEICDNYTRVVVAE